MAAKNKVLVLGQTPPPHHGQALSIERLVRARLDHTTIHHVRMAFSSSMQSVGHFEWKKVVHLASVIARALFVRYRHGADILYFPPAGPNRVPVLRDIILLLVLRRFFSKVIFHFRAGGVSEFLEAQPKLLRQLARKAYDHPDGAIQLSRLDPPDAEYVHAKRATVIPNGLEDAARPFLGREDGRGDDTMHILFTGVISESKGILVLLDAFRQIAPEHPNLRLWCMGEFVSDEFKRRVERICEEGGLSDVVSFLGKKVDQEKWEYFHRADIFCFPSFYECETFGNVLVEAMMFQLPVVATQWRGIPDVVEDGVTGHLVPVRDPHALADALRALITNPGLRGTMGANGRRRYLEQFALELHLARMESFFDEVARLNGR